MLSIDYMMRKPLKEDALYDHIRLWAAGMEEREKELSEETRFRKQVDQVFKAFDLRTDSKATPIRSTRSAPAGGRTAA